MELLLVTLVPLLFLATGLPGLQVHHIAPYLGALLFAIPSLLALDTLVRVERLAANWRWPVAVLILATSLCIVGLLEMRGRTSDIPMLLVILPFAATLVLPLLSSPGSPTARRDGWRRLARLTVQVPLAQALAVWAAALASIPAYLTLRADAPFSWVPIAVATYLSVSALTFAVLLKRPGPRGRNPTPPLERSERLTLETWMGICALICSICLISIYVEILKTGMLSQHATTMSLALTAIFGTMGLFIAEGSRSDGPKFCGPASRWLARLFDLISVIYAPTVVLAAPSVLLGYHPAQPGALDSTFILLLIAGFGFGSMLHLGTRFWRGRAWIWSLPASVASGLFFFGGYAALF